MQQLIFIVAPCILEIYEVPHCTAHNTHAAPRHAATLPHNIQVKGKSAPLQAWSGPEGSRKLRFPHFVTTAQDGRKVVSLTHRPPLPPGNAPGTHFC